MKLLAAVFLALLFVVPASALERYDEWFETSTRIHFGSLVRSSWLKAIAMAESGMRFNARSPVGAQGLMQFMPATWADIAPPPYKALGPLDPEAAIWVAGKYLRRIWNGYGTAADTIQRKAFTNAGYNSGPGNVNRARNRCREKLGCNPGFWDSPNVEENLVTALRFQEETRNYVRRIRRFERQIMRGL